LRLFLAINLPAEVRHDLSDVALPLRECAPELSWVTEPRLHLTLKFLGEQPAERVNEIERATAAVATAHREIVMAIGGVGAFPNFRRPRVVWMAVMQDPRLELVHHDLEVAFQGMGFELEGRPFRPHITLARVRAPLSVEGARELARAARRITYREEVAVASIDVMQSELTTHGSVYTTLLAAPFRSD
jgi:RNA 2',3'-cyclic 3'-phosphodiesterase